MRHPNKSGRRRFSPSTLLTVAVFSVYALLQLGGVASAHSACEPTSLIPRPRIVQPRSGYCDLGRTLSIATEPLPQDSIGLGELLSDILASRHEPKTSSGSNTSQLSLKVRLGNLHPELVGWRRSESYVVEVHTDSLVVIGASLHGCFNGIQTLRQLVRGSTAGRIHRIFIDDYPELQWRGISDDISRGQASTLDDFRRILPRLAYYKVNLYCIYIEDMARFWSAPEVGVGRQALTPSEIRILSSEARRYHIALVPIFESLGHQGRLLGLESMKPYSESPPPAGALLWLGRLTWRCLPAIASALHLPDPERMSVPPQCFSSVSPTALDQVSTMACELSHSASSPFFHLGGDEPAGFGQGTSRSQVARLGPGTVYSNYMNALADRLHASGSSTALLYSDFILEHPAALSKLDKRFGIVDWHYDTTSCGETLGRLSSAGFTTLFASPGLWNWNNVYPNYSKAFRNTSLQAEGARQHAAAGINLSSWCDGGGECLRETNWLGYAYAAESAWETHPDYRDFTRRYVTTEFGSSSPRLSSALTLMAEQQFPSLESSQRVVYRPVRVARRSPSWVARMKSLHADMTDVRSTLASTFYSVRFAHDEVLAIDCAAARLQTASARELALDSIAVSLTLQSSGLSCASRGEQVAARINVLADSTDIQARRFESIWLRHNRSATLLPVLSRQLELAAALRRLAQAAAAGLLRAESATTGQDRHSR